MQLYRLLPMGTRTEKVTAGVCTACFIAGLPMVCDGGVYLFTLLDWHTASWAVLLLGMAEVRGISILFYFFFVSHSKAAIYCGSFCRRGRYKPLEPIDFAFDIEIRVT